MAGHRRALIAAIMAITVVAAPGGAIEVCRPNALGQISCIGQPTHGLDPLRVFPPRGRVESGFTGPPFIPGVRTNKFNDTILREGETPPPRPRICRTDTFGNLLC